MVTEAPPFPAVRRAAFVRALRRRCPQCGQGGLFARYASLRRSCAECDLVYRREQGAQTGSMYLSAAVTQVFAVSLMAIVWMFTDWSSTLSVAVTLPVVAAFCFLFLPFSQAIWVAVEYISDVVNGEDWVHPRS